MPTLESLTVDQLAALCGLERNEIGNWRRPTQPRCTEPNWFGVMRAFRVPGWEAYAYPYAPGEPIARSQSEHAALLALAKHLNLTPENPVKYKRIDRDPKTDDYVDYTPKAGDRWHFGRGPVWTVDANGRKIGPSMEPRAHWATCFILGHTTHIERPVKVSDVKGPDYQPKVGDVLCGPDGPLFVVSYVSSGGLPCVTPVGRKVPEVGLAVAHFALATRIERETDR